MADETDKASSARSDADDSDGTDRFDKTQDDRFRLREFDLDDSAEFDFYYREIEDSNESVITPTYLRIMEPNDEGELTAISDEDTNNNSLIIKTENLGTGVSAMPTSTERKKSPRDESDAIVHRLRHGDEEFQNQEIPTVTNHSSEQPLVASAAKRFFARIFDLTWILLVLLLSLAALLKVFNSTGFYPVSQSIAVQFVLAIVFLPLALILEAGVLSDFGNTPGKSLFGLKITHEGKNKIKYRQYFRRGGAIWFKCLACGIPILNLFTMLWQYRQLSKYKVTSYDKSIGTQVYATKTSAFKKLLLILCSVLLVSVIIFLLPKTVNLTDAIDVWNSLQQRVIVFIGKLQN